MTISYDTEVDAAYIQLVDTILPGQAAEQIHSIVTPGGRGEVTLDFDANGGRAGLPRCWEAPQSWASGCLSGPTIIPHRFPTDDSRGKFQVSGPPGSGARR